RSAQITNNSSISTPSKPIKPKISKRNDTGDKCREENDPTNGGIHSILQQTVMKLDIIDDRTKSVEQEMKASMEFVHAEVVDHKKENEERKKDLEVEETTNTQRKQHTIEQSRH
ncbi:Hypothetical predicted protein, partial [Paramuricea clavata]